MINIISDISRTYMYNHTKAMWMENDCSCLEEGKFLKKSRGSKEKGMTQKREFESLLEAQTWWLEKWLRQSHTLWESPLPARMLSSSFSVLPDLLFSGFLHERQEQVDRIKVTWSQRLNYKSTTVSKSLASSSRFLRKNNNDELTKYSTLSILFIQLCRFDLLFLCRHMIGKSL